MAGRQTDIHAISARLLSLIDDRDGKLAHAARTLHDSIGQLLSAVGLQLDCLRHDFASSLPELPDRIHAIQESLGAAIEQVRELSNLLRSSAGEREGLHFALNRLIGEYRDRSGLQVRLLFDSTVRIPPALSRRLYRITELALENAVRHSGAAAVEVSVHHAGDGFALEVHDNGKGFDVDEAEGSNRGVGLLWMKHYADTPGMTLTVRSRPGEGTHIRVTFTAVVPALAAVAEGGASS